MNLYQAATTIGMTVQCMHCWWVRNDKDDTWEPGTELLPYASHGICITCLDNRAEYQDIKHKVSTWQQARVRGEV